MEEARSAPVSPKANKEHLASMIMVSAAMMVVHNNELVSQEL